MDTLSNSEFLLLVTVLTFLLSLTLSYVIYLFRVYKERKLSYDLFAARDALIRCVAIKAINKNDMLFKIFYNNVIGLINVIHTDFFTLNSFIKRIREIENDNKLKNHHKIITKELRKRSPEFQSAVKLMIGASQHIMIQKNFFLRLLTNVLISSFFIKKGVSFFSDRTKVIIKKRANYSEYQKLEEWKASLV